MEEILSKNRADTQKIARAFTKKITKHPAKGAVIVALSGNLGAGKTTFAQGFARALGVKEKVLSPTFVLIKIYKVAKSKAQIAGGKKYLIHIDCYRIESPKEILHLGVKEIFNDKDTVVLIEWAERIKKLLPSDTIWVKFKHGKKESIRKIIL